MSDGAAGQPVSVLLRHWELKLLSVVAALALWLFVAGGEKSELVVPAPVEYANLAPGLALAGRPQETVDVRVRALRTALGRLTPDDLRARVDLARAPGGEAVVELTPDDVRGPRDVTVLAVSPSRLRLRLEPVTTTKVRVEPELVGVPVAGYAVAGVSVRPPVVELSGPRSALTAQTAVRTAPIDVSGARGPVTRSVELEPGPGPVRLTRTRVVTVTVEIREEGSMPDTGRRR